MDPTSSSRENIQDKQSRASSVPSLEDWAFRVKVISSATNLDDEIFRDAIRGLVCICFPDGILEQLGQRVVEDHMREHNADAANIQRMSEVFQSELIRHLAYLLGTYFDTSDQVISTIQLAIAPHRNKASDSDNATVQQPSITKESMSDKDTGFPDPIPLSSQAIRQEDALGNKDRSVMSIEDAVSVPNAALRKRKDKKISSNWQWNIDPTEIADEDINATFPRTAELFAYHALPMAQRKLGSKAPKKELRLDMQSALDAMPRDEFSMWV